jgi:hypothetical protein
VLITWLMESTKKLPLLYVASISSLHLSLIRSNSSTGLHLVMNTTDPLLAIT